MYAHDLKIPPLAYSLRQLVLNMRRNVPLSPSGTGRTDTDMFPEVDSTWKVC